MMGEFKDKKLHSGKNGPVVTKRRQAVAIAMSESGQPKKKKKKTKEKLASASKKTVLSQEVRHAVGHQKAALTKGGRKALKEESLGSKVKHFGKSLLRTLTRDPNLIDNRKGK